MGALLDGIELDNRDRAALGESEDAKYLEYWLVENYEKTS